MTDIKTLQPRILRASVVVGDTLSFHDACIDDAEFILSLRNDLEKGRYLSATSNDVDAQKAWLAKYAESEGQAYFIIKFNDERIGTVRLYDARQDSFCWGSWILMNGRPRQAAMESALMVYAYAIDHLGFKACHFDVRKGNTNVIKFHERFGAQIVEETELDYLFSISPDSISSSRLRYTEFLSGSVTVGEAE